MTKPAGSTATFLDNTAQATSFIADFEGEYVVSLTVNDSIVDSVPSTATVLATSIITEVGETLQETIVTVNAIPVGDLKNRKLLNPLTNKINAVLTLIDDGEIAAARDKLVNDVLKKTNGCANLGDPDKNDWITSCSEQDAVYALIIDIIALLDDLL